MAQPINSFTIPPKFMCTIAQCETIDFYKDKVVFGEYTLYYKDMIGVRPSKERDGFYIVFSNEEANPCNETPYLSCHFRADGFFAKNKAKKFGMGIYTELFGYVTAFNSNKTK